jgi:hypothetical protein
MIRSIAWKEFHFMNQISRDFWYGKVELVEETVEWKGPFLHQFYVNKTIGTLTVWNQITLNIPDEFMTTLYFELVDDTINV